MKNKKIINKANLILETRHILEKVGKESMVNDLTAKVKLLTQKVNSGENVEQELKNSIERLFLVLKDDTIDETFLSEGLSNYVKMSLIAGLMALGMNNAQAQEKVQDVISVSSTNKSGEINLNSKTKINLLNTINSKFKSEKGVKQIVITIVGKASQVTAPKGITNEELATQRAEEAKQFIKDKYGDKVFVSDTKIEMGDTKYIKGVSSSSDSSFEQEQGVEIRVKAIFGVDLSGEFNTVTVNPGKNPDNLVVYNQNGEILASTGFFGSGDKYHPHYILRTTLAISENQDLAKYNEQFNGSIDELKTILTSPLGDKDTYYKKAMQELIQRYNNNEPIYLYKLADSLTLDLSGKGFVTIKVVTNDNKTKGDVSIKDSNNQTINASYDLNGFSIIKNN
jgi:hypothetical protein